MNVPSCSLRVDQAAPQAERWRKVARAAVAVERSGHALAVTFGEDVPASTVERLIAVERECCPFFLIRYDGRARRLEMTVDDPQHAPALDAVADSLDLAVRRGQTR
jgi:hypothetical protein